MSKSVVRSVKNVTKGYSSVQVKVRNATSNDPWGPEGHEMSAIAQMTGQGQSEFHEIMEILTKRLNDKGKNWRHVLKSLMLLDYCLHEGSEFCVTWARKNIYLITTLREFVYFDDDGRDVGESVRKSAKALTALINDEDRLRAERHDRKLWKARVTGLNTISSPPPGGSPSEPPKPRNERRPREDDDMEYRLALEASKTQAEEDRKRRESQSGAVGGEDDDDLARAIKLSKEEDELRRKELEQQNMASLFDYTPTPTQQQSQPTGWNQGYQQQSAVDWFGNPMEQQQPQSTGFLNNAYNQPAGFPNGYGYNPYQQTGFDQMQLQQQPQYMQQQQTAFNMNNPYGQPMNNQLMQSQPSQQQEEPAPKPGTHNPWSNLENQESLAPQPTGSNNPFATSFTRPQPAHSSAQKAPTLNTLAEQKTTTQFNPFPSSSSQQQPQPQPQQPENDSYTSRLNALLASGDGQDTFGNVGDLRIPAQHTAPGKFVNSAGSHVNRLEPVQTGTNPFMQSQFTGMPTQSQMPAQTGPMNAFGGGYGAGFASSNPFSTMSGQQQQFPGQQPRQNQNQGNSLIDL